MLFFSKKSEKILETVGKYTEKMKRHISSLYLYKAFVLREMNQNNPILPPFKRSSL